MSSNAWVFHNPDALGDLPPSLQNEKYLRLMGQFSTAAWFLMTLLRTRLG